MRRCEWPAVAYIVKRYPRYSETFIVTEILAHEEAGANIEIFALRPPSDTHFQDAIGRVRAPVTYIPFERVHVPTISGRRFGRQLSCCRACGRS